MLKNTFVKASDTSLHLLSDNNYRSYDTLCSLSENNPDKTKAEFKKLYNGRQSSSQDNITELTKRAIDFCRAFEKHYTQQTNGLKQNSYQDHHAVSVYLSFEFPEKYCIFNRELYDAFKKLINFKPTGSEQIFTLECNIDLCQKISEYIKNDGELLEMYNSRLNDAGYKDDSLNLLTFVIMDFAKPKLDIPYREYDTKTKDDDEKMDDNNRMNISKNTILYSVLLISHFRHRTADTVCLSTPQKNSCLNRILLSNGTATIPFLSVTLNGSCLIKEKITTAFCRRICIRCMYIRKNTKPKMSLLSTP
jgi:hypothetical protein